MDYGASGEINFEEYVFSLWDFLTNDLHHFVFQVFGMLRCLNNFDVQSAFIYVVFDQIRMTVNS